MSVATTAAAREGRRRRLAYVMPAMGALISSGFLLFMGIADSHAQMYCDRPRKPDIPYGSYAKNWEMQQARYDVEEYVDDMRKYSDCLEMEQADAISEANRIIQEWNDSVAVYNRR